MTRYAPVAACSDENDERVMAERMLPVYAQGYIVTDRNYASNRRHALCDQRHNRQMVKLRRYGKNKGT